MKKNIIILLVICIVFNTAVTANAKANVLEKNEYYYYIEKLSEDQVTKGELENESSSEKLYSERYVINFISKDDELKKTSKSSNVITGKIKVKKNGTIKFKPKDINKFSLIDEEISLPLDDEPVQSNFQLRSITTNLFVGYEDQNGNIKTLKESEVNHTTTFNKASNPIASLNSFSVNDSLILASSARQNFTYMYSSIYVYDEYNYDRSKKRHKFEAYHMKYNSINSGLYHQWVSTTQYDNEDDVVTLLWGLGGAIGLNDPSINLSVAYNHKCSCGTIDYKNLSKYSPEVSKHDTAFSGQSIAFNIPDTFDRNMCSFCGDDNRLEPAGISIGATTGWYNTGSYNGATGTVRSEYIHTYKNKTLTVSPSIGGPPAAVFLNFNSTSTNELDRAWIYAVISPE